MLWQQAHFALIFFTHRAGPHALKCSTHCFRPLFLVSEGSLMTLYFIGDHGNDN